MDKDAEIRLRDFRLGGGVKISFSFLLYFNFFAFSLLDCLDFENLKRQGESGGKRREWSKIRAE